MECRYEDADGVRVIYLTGRMDVEGSQEVALRFTALTVSGGSSMVVDLSGLDFISSLGIGTIVAAARAVKQRKAMLALCGATPNVATALLRTSIPAIIPTCSTLDEARAIVTAPAEP